jgi:hypothetical protein
MRECTACTKVKSSVAIIGVGLQLCDECHEKWRKVRDDARSVDEGFVTHYCYYCGTAIQLDPSDPGCGMVTCVCGQKHQLDLDGQRPRIEWNRDRTLAREKMAHERWCVIGFIIILVPLLIYGIVLEAKKPSPPQPSPTQVECRGALEALAKIQILTFEGGRISTVVTPDGSLASVEPQKTE